MTITSLLHRPNWLWLLIYSLGIPVCWAIEEVSGDWMQFTIPSFKDWVLCRILTSLLTGAIVGMIQWFLMGGRVFQWRWWLLVSCFGWLLGHILTIVVGNAVSSTINLALYGNFSLAGVWIVSDLTGGAIGGAIGGAVSSSAPWLLLRGQVPQAYRWVVANVAGWAFGTAVIAVVRLAMVDNLDVTLGFLIAWTLYGVIYGMITGEVLLGWNPKLSKNSKI